MRKSRYSEEQIIGMLREHEAGVTTKELCRKYGISDATFYKYKAKFGGMTVSDAQRLRTLEAENAKLKKLLAEQMLDHPHDLIHKATGWMLREVGKQNPAILDTFLNQHAASMPRTMLRYSIEKLSPSKRKHFMDL